MTHARRGRRYGKGSSIPTTLLSEEPADNVGAMVIKGKVVAEASPLRQGIFASEADPSRSVTSLTSCSWGPETHNTSVTRFFRSSRR